jgi:RHS repeat-associated protein
MVRKLIRSTGAILLAGALIPAQVLAGIPTPPPNRPEKEAAPPVRVNRTVPPVALIAARPVFSRSPSDQEIFRARVFGEPLVPSGATSPAENVELVTALNAYLDAPARDHVQPLMQFLHDRPNSAWRLALLANMATVLRRTAHYSRALAVAEEVWRSGRGAQDPRVQALVNDALANVAELYSRLGRREQLKELLNDIQDYSVRGSATERISGAKQALWLMENKPEESFRCGPLALRAILRSTRPAASTVQLDRAQSTPQGTSLSEMARLADAAGLHLQPAFRSPYAEIKAPAMVHWRAGHYAAIVRNTGDRYLVQDPTFGEEVWVSKDAIEEESSGYFLIGDGPLPPGWRAVDTTEGQQVWGKGVPAGQNQQATKKTSNNSGGNNGARCPFMAGYTFHTLLANLTISDIPVGYSPPVGPAVQFEATYNFRDAYQPAIFTFPNLGAKWTFDWISYVTDDPGVVGQSPTVYLRGAGAETFTGYDATTLSYSPHFMSRAVLKRVTDSPIKYERLLPDGSKEVFAQPDGALTAPRRVFMTEAWDPQGNHLGLTYDSSFRLVAITDAIGQVTTLSYDLTSDPLRITKVTDPFGRFASFEYNASGQLIRITDVVGIVSEFDYSVGDFIASLTTPYGTTKFSYGESGAERWVEAIDPLEGRERLAYQNAHTALVDATDPGARVPAGFLDWNGSFNSGFSLFWDKRAMSVSPGDPAAATIYNWMWDFSLTTDVIRTIKKPLENRVWFAYPGQVADRLIGNQAVPAVIARVLDDGTTQAYRYEYNSRGLKTKEIDPVGRETRYTYGTNNTPDPDPTTGTGIDLLKVERKNGAVYDLVATRTYNSQHEPLTVTDAAGQTTTYAYDPQGRVQTVMTPSRGGLSSAERTTTYAYYPDNAPTGAGRVQTVTGPSTPQGAPVTSYTYDGYGRVQTTTDPDGYALTYDYDALDRPTRTTYPDATYEETVYNRLDVEKRRDRLGRWTHIFHDALRRPVAIRDPLGRTVTQQWCNCGSLDKLIDANGNTTSWESDLQGRMTKEIRVDQGAKTFVYENTTSRLQSVTDARNQTKAYGYAVDNKLTSIVYTSAVIATPNVTFNYMDPDNPTLPDPHGRLRLMTDGTGTTRYDYKPAGTPGAGSLSSVDGPFASDAVGYSYDELSRVTTHGVSAFSTTSGYDVLGRLTTLTAPMGNFLWSYVNTSARPQTVTYPNGQTTNYSYFSNLGDQRLQQIKHQQTTGGSVLSQFDYTYDAVGNIKTWTQQRGADPAKLYTLGYDAGDQLLTATVTGPNPLPIPNRFRYAYDTAGNRTAEELDDGGMTASYNARNQLTSRQPGGSLLFRGALSEQATVTVQGKPAQVASDNSFTAQAQAASGATDVAVAATDPSGNTRTNTYRITQSGSTTSYTYDPNGNLTGDGARTLEWDAEDRLTRVTQGASELARFAYDGQGRRVQKIAAGVTRTYIYDGANIIEERLSSGETYDYVQGPGIDRPLAVRDQATVVTYYLADHLGSIVQTTNSPGSVTLTREYDPWGSVVQGSSTSGYAFTGREWDSETNLYYYTTRYYDPGLGRFLSEDAIGLNGGPNYYAYVANSPTNLVDPFGFAPQRTNPCDPFQFQACAKLCGGADKVLLCQFTEYFRVTQVVSLPNGQPLTVFSWVPTPPLCVCKPPEKPRLRLVPPGAATVCPIIVFDPCLIAPQWCCNGKFTGPAPCVI